MTTYSGNDASGDVSGDVSPGDLARQIQKLAVIEVYAKTAHKYAALVCQGPRWPGGYYRITRAERRMLRAILGGLEQTEAWIPQERAHLRDVRAADGPGSPLPQEFGAYSARLLRCRRTIRRATPLLTQSLGRHPARQ